MLRRLFLYCLRKPIPFFALGIAGAACLAFLQQAVVSFAADRAEPGRGACWIWAQDAANAAQPLAFWAVRDFQLMDPADLESASVVIAADESYELWLNGQRVGAGEYVQGMAADQYSVSHLLQLGSNRLVVELRSSRGAGGLLASVSFRATTPGASCTRPTRRCFGALSRWTVLVKTSKSGAIPAPVDFGSRGSRR